MGPNGERAVFQPTKVAFDHSRKHRGHRVCARFDRVATLLVELRYSSDRLSPLLSPLPMPTYCYRLRFEARKAAPRLSFGAMRCYGLLLAKMLILRASMAT